MLRLYFFGLLLLVGFVQASPVDSDLAYIEDIRSASPRIVGGWEAKDGQFPYTVSIRMVGPTGGVGACTGSILTNQWILTAAHCLARRFTYVVRLGQTNITKPGYMVEATERYIHEGYNQESTGVQTEDIGLLKLDHYIPYGDSIQPIRCELTLRIQSSQRKNVEYGDVQLTLSGYGRTDDWWAGGIVPDILYWTYQRGMTQQECRTWYPNSQVINVQTICSQYYDDPSQNPCTGDSGGPLTMVDVDGKVTQVGIMSFGSQRGCNTPNPQGFVRPDYYQDWIEKQTGISFDWDVEELESLQNNESA
nr:collagenase [Helicoverpa armigera]